MSRDYPDLWEDTTGTYRHKTLGGETWTILYRLVNNKVVVTDHLVFVRLGVHQLLL